MASSLLFSSRFMANNRVEIDGDVAHSETYVLFVLRRKDGSKIDFGGGRYVDRLERRDGEWRIAARELVIDWRAEADPSEHGGVRAYPSGAWDPQRPVVPASVRVEATGVTA